MRKLLPYLIVGFLTSGVLLYPEFSSADSPAPTATSQTGLAAPPAQPSPAEPNTAEAESCPPKKAKKKGNLLEESGKQLIPILCLVLVVGFVLARLPKVEGVNHTKAFRKRRIMNWLPLGLTYAFLYMGRYNLTVAKRAFENMEGADAGMALMGNADFGYIFLAGTVTYGVSFVINGPLTDRVGGRKAILFGAMGAAIANVLMGLSALTLLYRGPGYELVAQYFVPLFAGLYAANMYFQSFGAVAIVKVNASWFHVRERGVFGAIFGILISLGVYFAFDWGKLILNFAGLEWVFFVPATLLLIFWVIDLGIVRNTPSEAGQKDFDTADASSGDDGPRLPAIEVFKKMMKNPVIVTIALVEFCSGFLRQAIMQWYGAFAKQTDATLGLDQGLVSESFGVWLCIAGILGGVLAGVISDRVFQSRRGPVAGLLYAIMGIGAIVLTFGYDTAACGWIVIVMSMAIIGVHGMLSGTASMDFGGRKNVGVAVGIIDGFVYLGTGAMSLTYALILPDGELDQCDRFVGDATNPDNWLAWPISMIVVAVIGTLLAVRLWNARPKPKQSS